MLLNTIKHESSHDVDIGGKYGQIPDEMLIQKYEYTDDNDEDELMEDHARLTLTDRRPDSVLFPSDEPSRSCSYSKLNLLHGGHRGAEDDPSNPEAFIDFVGDWGEKRRADNTPNMRALADQSQQRIKYTRWTPDSSEQITSGQLNERDQAEAVRRAKFGGIGRMQVFSSQRDCMRNGKRVIYAPKSHLTRHEPDIAPTIGHKVKDADYKLGMSSASLYGKERESKWMAKQMADLARSGNNLYGVVYATSGKLAKAGVNRDIQTGAKMAESDDYVKKRAVVTAMKGVLRAETMANMGTEDGTIATRKAKVETLKGILRETRNQTKWATSDEAFTAAAWAPSMNRTSVGTVDQRIANVEHGIYVLRGTTISKPRELYKSVKWNKLGDSETVGVATAKAAESGRYAVGQAQATIEVDGEESKIFKTANLERGLRKVIDFNGEKFKSESDTSVTVHNVPGKGMAHTAKGLERDQSKFYENLTKTRLAAPISDLTRSRRHQTGSLNTGEKVDDE